VTVIFLSQAYINRKAPGKKRQMPGISTPGWVPGVAVPRSSALYPPASRLSIRSGANVLRHQHKGERHLYRHIRFIKEYGDPEVSGGSSKQNSRPRSGRCSAGGIDEYMPCNNRADFQGLGCRTLECQLHQGAMTTGNFRAIFPSCLTSGQSYVEPTAHQRLRPRKLSATRARVFLCFPRNRTETLREGPRTSSSVQREAPRHLFDLQ
jgi:hypothetical protein